MGLGIIRIVGNVRLELFDPWRSRGFLDIREHERSGLITLRVNLIDPQIDESRAPSRCDRRVILSLNEPRLHGPIVNLMRGVGHRAFEIGFQLERRDLDARLSRAGAGSRRRVQTTTPNRPSHTGRAGCAWSMRIVVSIGSGSSGSGTTSSINRSATGGGAAGGAAGGALGGGAGAGEALPPRGSSRSRNTRLDVLRVPDFERSSPALGGGFGAGALTRDPAAEARLPGSLPYILSCSANISRRLALSGEISVNSFNAANACSILPTFCIRSAYSTKFCFASAMKPLAAYSFASFR